MKSKNNRISVIIILNIVLPLIAGVSIYYFYAPDVIVIQMIDKWVGIERCLYKFDGVNGLELIRNYIPDMLWGYALVFGVFYVFGNSVAELANVFMIVCVFTIFIESMQITTVFRGTFDVWDIVVMVLAEVFATFIIKKLLLRRNFK